MLIMEPDGSIAPCTPAPAASEVDMSLERVLLLSEDIGNEIAGEVRAMVDARLAHFAGRLGPLGANWSMAAATG